MNCSPRANVDRERLNWPINQPHIRFYYPANVGNVAKNIQIANSNFTSSLRKMLHKLWYYKVRVLSGPGINLCPSDNNVKVATVDACDIFYRTLARTIMVSRQNVRFFGQL